MYTAVKATFRYLFRSEDDNSQEEIVDNDDPISSLIENVVLNSETLAEESQPPERPPVDLIQHRTGYVTKLGADTGCIDSFYQFNKRDCLAHNVEVGCKVTYTCFRRHENEEWRVTKILAVHEENWNDEGQENEFPNFEDEPPTVQSVPANQRTIVGVVQSRKGRMVFVRDEDSKKISDKRSTPRITQFSLDNVSSNFLPEEGDVVCLEAIVQIDPESVNIHGDIADVISVRPQRYRPDRGTVRFWRKRANEGMIDDDIYFNKEACCPGYSPKAQDQVKVEVIENEGRDWRWRALSVEPLSFLQENCDDDDTRKNKVLPPRLDPDRAANKNNVVVSENVDLGLVNLGENQEFSIFVTNNGMSNKYIKCAYLKAGVSQSQIKLLSPSIPKQTLAPSQTITYKLMCSPSCFGYSYDIFVVEFVSFGIDRLISWEVNSDELRKHNSTVPVHQQYDRKACFESRTQIRQDQNYREMNRHLRVPGIKPVQSPNFVPVKMCRYEVPKHFEEMVYSEKVSSNLYQQKRDLQEKFPHLSGPLKGENYKERMHSLLYILEIDAKIDIGRYNMNRMSFRRAGPMGEFLALEVQGLAEKRPSLLVGDCVSAVSSSEGVGAPQFEGFIHKVQKNEVWLKFHNHFHVDYNGQDYNIYFQLSRSTYNRCHYAVDLCLSRQALMWLFPDSVFSKPPQIKFQESELYSDNMNSEYSVSSDSSNSASNLASILTNNRKVVLDNSEQDAINSHPVAIPLSSRPYTNGAAADLSPDEKVLQGEPINGCAPFLAQKKAISSANDMLRNAGSDFSKPAQLRWANPRLNSRQKDAVRNILRGEGRPLPFIIFGPPGTGKTVTLVEAILQVFLLKPDSRILVATPSNSSADLVAERLLDSKKIRSGEMVRIVGFHLVLEGRIPPKLAEHCTTLDINANAPDERQQTSYGIYTSSGRVIGRHRIMVGTCGTLGQLHALKFPPGHFTHVFVDEAGQATEPEILLPLGFLTIDKGQAVLAGDPHQLGPVVPSRLAAELGYDKSLLARLLPRFPYKRDPIGFPDSGGYDPRLVTRLNLNYRSLPDILELPSSLFYDSELEAMIQEEDSFEANFLASFTESANLPRSAVIFHGVQGDNLLEHDSPSWFNLQEIYQITQYMTKLADFNIDLEDIGIITPYQKQVQKLRASLERMKLPVPKIGSVEEFQGQERLVIILSTVRSSKDLISTDVKHSLGFVSCKERLNVAISRARALLIIIGNPYVLSLDCYWRSVLQYCVEKKAYVGCSFFSEIVET